MRKFFKKKKYSGANQGSKFRSVPAGTAGIFRSVPKIGTEYGIKNFGQCFVLFRPELPELPELPESGRYTYSGRNRRIKFYDINKKKTYHLNS